MPAPRISTGGGWSISVQELLLEDFERGNVNPSIWQYAQLHQEGNGDQKTALIEAWDLAGSCMALTKEGSNPRK